MMMGYYYSDDPTADFNRWERDREELCRQLREEGLLEDDEETEEDVEEEMDDETDEDDAEQGED